jgi:hypothetical protein
MVLEDGKATLGSHATQVMLYNDFLKAQGVYLADICDCFSIIDKGSLLWAGRNSEELVSDAESSEEFLDTVQMFSGYLDAIKHLPCVKTWCVEVGGVVSPESIFYNINLPLRSADDLCSPLYDTLEHKSPSVHRSDHLILPSSDLELRQNVKRLRLGHLNVPGSYYYQVKPTRAFEA